MGKGQEATIVYYKPDSQKSEEYVIIIEDNEEYNKYKAGDTSVALSLIVGSFDVFHCPTGHTGIIGKASKQQLETDFETSKEEEAIKQILEKGTKQPGSGFVKKWADTNNNRGGSMTTSQGGNR